MPTWMFTIKFRSVCKEVLRYENWGLPALHRLGVFLSRYHLHKHLRILVERDAWTYQKLVPWKLFILWEGGITTSLVFHQAILCAFKIHNQINLHKLVKDLLWQKITVHGCTSARCVIINAVFLIRCKHDPRPEYLNRYTDTGEEVKLKIKSNLTSIFSESITISRNQSNYCGFQKTNLSSLTRSSTLQMKCALGQSEEGQLFVMKDLQLGLVNEEFHPK
jgi:hypothetical protein